MSETVLDGIYGNRELTMYGFKAGFLESMALELHGAGSARKVETPRNAANLILEKWDTLWAGEAAENNPDPVALRAELVQIAAMCWRASRDLGLENGK